MSLYVGEDKNKSWEDLLGSLSRFKDTQKDAEFIATCLRLCQRPDQDYISWLARCALHLLNTRGKECARED